MNRNYDGKDCSNEDEIKKLQFKIVLLGDGTVGKSSMAMRFADELFDKNYKQTVGCDFIVRRLDMPPNYQVALQLWDIGGQSINSKMISKYIAGSHAVLLCYDITNYDSFANFEDWYRIMLETFRGQKLPYTVLLGNKSDLRYMSAVTIDQHNSFADENGMASYIISAKTGDQVKRAFWMVATKLANITNHKAPLHELNSYTRPAVIIDHKRHDDSTAGGEVPIYTKKRQYDCCIS